jgi:nitroreductase
LAETIRKRKSTREFSDTAVEIFDNNTDLIEHFGILPLAGDIKVKVKVLKKNEVNNKRSSYCIAFYSEEKPRHLENIGFIGQQLDLALQSMGIGTCWWGMKKPKRAFKKTDGLSCIITMTAGYPKETETRAYPDGFIRKKTDEIITANTTADSLIEAARIAPSAVNLQPWLIEKADSKYNFYIRPPKSMMEKMIKDMRRIDMGIAMAHLYVQAKADGKNVSFSFDGEKIKQGNFIGSIIVS